jgi:adenylosuccinate lyase
MPPSYTHSTFLSPFTWRYGSDAMRRVWSEEHKRQLWRRIWVVLAEAQQAAGLVTAEQVADLRAHQQEIDLARAHEIEAEIHHDLMAEIRCFAGQCPIGGKIIHLGATSMDVEDNADALRLREGLELLLAVMRRLLLVVADRVERHAGLVCMGFTHLQPAEPTTVGYRLASYAQDLLADWTELRRVRSDVRGKGFKGAVGTSASYAQLLVGAELTPADLEARAMSALELAAFPVTNQTYPRRQDWTVLNALAGTAMTIYRLAFDLRLLQSPPFGEWAESFGAAQVGSSAMPFKRNPINAENLDSLARWVAAMPRIAWDNAAHHLLERTLDDSANRRVLLAEAFLATDELLHRATRLVEGLGVDELAVRRNLETYGVFAATERLLMAAVRAGGDRQVLHEAIRQQSLAAWEAVRRGQANPLADALAGDERMTHWIPPEQIRSLLLAGADAGEAPERARALADTIRAELATRILEGANS